MIGPPELAQTNISSGPISVVPTTLCDAPEDLGECDYDARTITINRDIIDAPNRIEVIIHEAIHAAQPDLKEEAVQRIGLAITNALQVMGIL